MKIEVSVSKANRIINPGCVVMVTSAKAGRANIITLAWQMPVSHNPMLVAISVAKTHYSNGLIRAGKEFVINVPTVAILDKVILCGTKSGRDADKFNLAKLTPIPAKAVKPPLIKECIGHLECAVKDCMEVGDHTIFVGEVLRASADNGLFDEAWNVENEDAKLLFHLGGDKFTVPGGLIRP